MLKTMQIDFVREILNKTLRKNATEVDYFSDYDISLFSFYEHLSEREEVDRYVERYNDLVNQQNKSNLIGFGILSTTSTPSITNIMSSFISPFEWACSIRCTLGNRDKMIATIYKLFKELKGRKQDVAQLNNGKLVMVGTLGNGGEQEVKDYDFIGQIEGTSPSTEIENILDDLPLTSTNVSKVYVQINEKLHLFEKKVGVWVDISNEDNNVDGVIDTINVPKHTSFEKYKVSMSFDDLKVDEPFTLNSNQYCTITFGGSATLCDNSIRLGNDLVRLLIKKDKIKGEQDYVFDTEWHSLEPLDMPSGNSANTIPNQLRSNYFKTNSHTDSISLTLQYSFVCDLSESLISQWFYYGRYGVNGLDAQGQIQQNSITPNIIYDIVEFYSSWGVYKQVGFRAKIVEDIDIENTESDVMTLDITFQIQGAND